MQTSDLGHLFDLISSEPRMLIKFCLLLYKPHSYILHPWSFQTPSILGSRDADFGSRTPFWPYIFWTKNANQVLFIYIYILFMYLTSLKFSDSQHSWFKRCRFPIFGHLFDLISSEPRMLIKFCLFIYTSYSCILHPWSFQTPSILPRFWPKKIFQNFSKFF
jgi:hypothetical protein